MNNSLLQVQVTDVQDVAIDVRSFALDSATGGPLPRFTPGSHVYVHVGDALVRQYSVCNRPVVGGDYRISVKREPQSRGGCKAMHDRVNAGDALEISRAKSAVLVLDL